MYHPQSVPAEQLLPHQDVVFNGVPALIAEARLELFYSDRTVVIFGEDSGLRNAFAQSLQPGSRVLTGLSQYNISFEPQCADQPTYCEGIRGG